MNVCEHEYGPMRDLSLMQLLPKAYPLVLDFCGFFGPSLSLWTVEHMPVTKTQSVITLIKPTEPCNKDTWTSKI